MNIYFMRHGETDWNTVKRLQGTTDIPLNTRGVVLAEQTARALHKRGIHFDRVFTSPLTRALTTAALMNVYSRAPLIRDERLMEFCFGAAEGTMFTEIMTNPRFAWLANWFTRPEAYTAALGAESFAHFFARINSFLDMLRKLEADTSTHLAASDDEAIHSAATPSTAIADNHTIPAAQNYANALPLAADNNTVTTAIAEETTVGEGTTAITTQTNANDNNAATSTAQNCANVAPLATNSNILIVCHGGVVRGLLTQMSGWGVERFASAKIPNCGIHRARLHNGVFTIISTAELLAE